MSQTYDPIYKDDYWNDLTQIAEIVKLILIGIYTGERLDANLSDVFYEIENIRLRLKACHNNENDIIRKISQDNATEKRLDDILSNEHYLAAILDHRKEPLPFNKEIHKKASSVIDRLCEAGVCNESKHTIIDVLECFWKRKFPYRNIEEYAEKTPKEFWNLPFIKHSPIAPVALRIFSISPSTASVERSFSIQNYVHSKVRNRLSHDKVNKIMTVKMNELRKEQRAKGKNLSLRRRNLTIDAFENAFLLSPLYSFEDNSTDDESENMVDIEELTDEDETDFNL